MIEPVGLRVAFLDRDGVVNQERFPAVRKVRQLRFLPGVPEALRHLKESGFRTVLVTNKATVFWRVLSPRANLEILDHMQSVLASAGAEFDRIEFCAENPLRHPRRRKPRPGMLEDAASAIGPIDRARSFMVGDNVSDALAGLAFGVRPILLATTHPAEKLSRALAKAGARATVVADLPAAVEIMVAETGATPEPGAAQKS